MKKLFLSIIILILTISESFAQWKPFPFEDATFLGVTDSTLFANAAQSHLYRYDPALAGPPVYGWIESDTGLGTGPDKAVTACGSIGPYLCVGTNIGGFYRSIDTGKHWTITGYGLPGASYSGFITIDSMLIAATGGIFRSLDSGIHWTESDSGLNNSVTALATLGTNIFSGGGGGVYRSTDNGHHWVTTGFPTGNVASVVIIGTDIFVGVYGGGVYLSADSGGHWATVNSGLTDLAVKGLVSDGKNLFVAGESQGIFISKDGGGHWDTVNAGLPYLNITVLTIFDTNLVAGINDVLNGISNLYIRPISEMVDSTKSAVQEASLQTALTISVYPNPLSNSATIAYLLPESGMVTIVVSDALGRQISIPISEFEEVGNHQVNFEASTIPSGMYWCRLMDGERTQTTKLIIER